MITSSSITTCAVGLAFLLSVICHLPIAAALVFNYSTFGPDDKRDIRVEGDAYINGGWIDVSANRLTGIGGSRGRASYSAQPMLLWDKDTGDVASFTTRFSFSIEPQKQYGDIDNKGTGMAFFLASYPSSLPLGSQPYDMGLTNQSADAVATGDARFVAVEFDTFNDSIAHDPNTTYDHIGIDVNSIRSVATETLPSFTLNGSMTAEIKYDNLSSVLEMTLWLGDGRGSSYNLSHKVDLKSALPENVSVGFSASTSTSVELHRLRSWYFSSSLEPKAAPAPTPTTSGSGRGGVIAGATVGAALFLVLLFATAALLARRRQSKRMRELEEELGEVGGSDDDDGDEPIMQIEMGTGPRRFPYHELVAATKSFAPEEKLGQGGFGSVYRGYLRDAGGLVGVAIKRFAKESSMQGRKEYKSEIKVISRLRHRNLVQLVGWCHGRDELLLVYELFPNRSLDVHLHGDGGGGTFLTWPMRTKIVLGLGSALLYLHEEWEQCVVHRDVKPSNVMLDESFNAKLGDFGLARFIDHAVGMQTMTAVSGTPGYVDPESLITGKASAESDVYSFGVVVLEVTCGRRPMSLVPDGGGQKNAVFRLVEWAWDLYGRGSALAAADERLKGEYDAAEVESAVAVGLWCAHPDPRARPSIREAMAALQSNGPVPALPAKMPVPTYAAPVASPEGLFSSYSASSSGMTSSSLTQSTTTTTTTHTSCTSESSTSTGLKDKDSSSLLKHQY
ncbi:L-type lectin-domain containing receptor kinase IX.1 [Dichanthelium oligosanthes]|uniref:non-specific serine/threonine protein kinase n=1 Tax=Dichanthelium oligosanthes TaxID=888268 RepID=A0A1E5V4E6_9POAL|nr:L-type lectin-domain containing receptor kinase IX.1 [Dichanthelium oligosanthes]